jgi:hypothetical protein
MKMGEKITTADLLELRNTYGDEKLAEQVRAVFTERHGEVVKGAKKFAEAIRQKYANSNIPYHQLLMKARLHARKLALSEAEFSEFQRIYEQELAGTGRANEVVLPLTNMMKVLGNISGSGSGSGVHVSEGDYRNLDQILRLYEESRPLHAQVVLQSLQYQDMAPEALNGTLDRARHNPGEHVHPVVAALFLPKVDILTSHFLYSNMAGIVKNLYNREPLRTRPDYELYYNLVTDPNDVVCDNRTPVADLLQRCNLQNQLWNAVLHLRNGQYFNSSFREFMTAIDTCRLNKHDNPDLVYGRHDGTVLKRLMSAFSFRPTVVATVPIANIFASNPYAQNVRPTVTNIPMINVRLMHFQTATPLTLTQGGVQGGQPSTGPVNLSQALTQTQTFIEGDVLVNRATDVIYSRQVLFFYVDRRAHIMNLGMNLFNLANLPTSVAGFERINQRSVVAPGVLDVRGDKFSLRSVVLADVQEANNNTNLVVGSSALINLRGTPLQPQLLIAGPVGPASVRGTRLYNPMGAIKNNNQVITNSDLNEAGSRGVIFMYQADNAKDEVRLTL